MMSESNPSSPTKENKCKFKTKICIFQPFLWVGLVIIFILDDSSEYLRYPLARAESEDITPRSRRSTTFGGQIDTQRGLLNRETLTLPKFLTPDFPPNIDDDDSFNKHRLDNVSTNIFIDEVLFDICRIVHGTVTKIWMV